MFRFVFMAIVALTMTTTSLTAKEAPRVLILSQQALLNYPNGAIVTAKSDIIDRLWKMVEQSSGSTTNTPPSGPCLSDGESKTTSSSSEGECRSDTGTAYACKCFYTNTYTCTNGAWAHQGSALDYCININSNLMDPAQTITIGD